MPCALVCRVHSDGVHLVLERRFAAQPRDAGVADQHAAGPRGHVVVVARGQLALKRYRRPRIVPVEQLRLQLGAAAGVGGCQRADGDGFKVGGHGRAANGLASGRRRYNATRGAGLSDQSGTAATSPAGVG